MHASQPYLSIVHFLLFFSNKLLFILLLYVCHTVSHRIFFPCYSSLNTLIVLSHSATHTIPCDLQSFNQCFICNIKGKRGALNIDPKKEVLRTSIASDLGSSNVCSQETQNSSMSSRYIISLANWAETWDEDSAAPLLVFLPKVKQLVFLESL